MEAAMPDAIGFDVYGTLVDPLAMDEHLYSVAGEELAAPLAALWRQKQLEYTFRRGLMRDYQNFDVCTRDALLYAARHFAIEIDDKQQAMLIDRYQHLKPFPDVIPAMKTLRERGHRLVAFSNGVAATLEDLLNRAGVLSYLDDIVSVDEISTFKPNPDVYLHLAGRVDRSPGETWLLSSNYWDITGARATGLRAAWVHRDPKVIPDPWGVEPDLVVKDLNEFCEWMKAMYENLRR